MRRRWRILFSLQLNLLVTWLDSYMLDDVDYAGTIGAYNISGAFPGGYQGVTSTIFHDLSARWDIKESLALTLGVRNLTDEQPKFFDSPIDQNTDPATFDTLGRFYFGSLRVKF